ncbi:MAG: hypothetical protein WB502_07360 [Thermoactinomyces sp.]
MIRRSWYRVLCLLPIFLLLPVWPVFGMDGDHSLPVRTGKTNPHEQTGTGQLSPPSGETAPGTWFPGATPPDADLKKPPIVFVQGLNGKAQSWWSETFYHGMNDMYETAFNYGYRTAFVQLHDAGGNPATYWENGKLLARMLEEIYRHFGQKVNIVAHSKGGLDTQAALVHYGASSYVNKVVTLGSPHYGSHVADLAYSWWAGWLAELLGLKSDATYSLQTGEMAKFREVTDKHPNTLKNRYYTAAGTNWGPPLSALWFGGAYLSAHGDNDGLVNVWSTRLPYGQHLFTSDVDHDEIRTGTASFAKMDSVLSTFLAGDLANPISSPTPSLAAGTRTNHFVRGGPLSAQEAKTETVPVDGSVDNMIIAVLTKSLQTEVKLVSPSGKVYSEKSRQFSRTNDQVFFRGAAVQLFQIRDRAESGDWLMQMKSPQTDAYLLVAIFPGKEEVSVSMPVLTDEKVPIQIKLNHAQLEPGQIQGTVRVLPPLAGMDGNVHKAEIVSLIRSRNNPDLSAQLHLKKPGTYNLTIEIRGVTTDGKPFARTIIRSVHVGKINRQVLVE